MNKFFLISQVYYPDEVSTANLFTILCRHLVTENTKAQVWAAQPSYTRSDKQPKKLILDGISIRYLASTRFHKSKPLGRTLNILTFMLSASLALLFSREKSPVFTHTTPPFLGAFISLICKIRKRKFIYILLDIFPEGLIRLKKISRNNPFTRLWNGMFLRSLKRSDRILVLGRDMQDFIEEIYPSGQTKIENIPHWQDESLITPLKFDRNPFVKELDLKDHFVVQYSGNMGLWNDMETIGRAANKSADDVKFLFIGDGLRKKELMNVLTEEAKSRSHFLPFQPGEKLSEALSASNVSLVSLRDGLEGMAVPSKIYGILASGVPVVALVPEKSEIAYIVNEEKCGIVVKPHDPDGLVDAIEIIRKDPMLQKKMGSNARLAFETKYTTEIIAKRYLDILEELTIENDNYDSST